MDLVGNDVDILHEEIKDLVDHLVGNDVDTLHEERIHLVGFSFIRVIDMFHNNHQDTGVDPGHGCAHVHPIICKKKIKVSRYNTFRSGYK